MLKKSLGGLLFLKNDDEMVEGLFRMGNAGGGHAGDFLYNKLFKQLRVNAGGSE